MPPPALYVCKAARRPRYRHENLHLLAAERGRVVEAAYNPMWVATGLLDEGAIPRGAPVYVLLTDRPYARLVPVRQGEVLEVVCDELLVRLRILLRGWIGAPGGDVDAFTRLVHEAAPAEAPGEKFVLLKRDDVVFERFFDGREDEGWRRAVDAVLAMSRAAEDDPYRGSVFFRPLGLRVGGELHESRRLPLEPGARAALALRFHNPHLSEGDAARLALRVLASDDARADAPERFPLEGDLDIPFEAAGPRAELTVEIGPAPVEHTTVTHRFAVRGGGEGGGGGAEAGPVAHEGLGGASGAAPARSAEAAERVGEAASGLGHAGARPDGIPESAPGRGYAGARPAASPVVAGGGRVHPADRTPPDAAAPVAVPRDEIARLHDVVFRNARLEPDDALDVLDAFQRLVPDDPRLAEHRALLLAARGDEEGAYRVLRALDPERLGDDARVLLFRAAVRRERAAAVVQRVLSLDLAADGRYPRLLDALESLEPAALGRLLPDLVDHLAPEQLRDLADRAGARIESGEAAARVALALYLADDDAARAYAWLDERRRALHLADPAVTDALLDLAAAAGGRADAADELGDDVARRIRNLIERGEPDHARALLRQAARALGRAQRDALHHRIADRLADRGELATAAEVMVELAWTACGTGDLEDATEAVQRARGLWARAEAGAGAGARAANTPEPDWLRNAIRHVEAAWRDCEELAEWRRTDEDRLRERLRARYLNRRILIAGGLRRQEWIDRLQELTGAEVDWAERHREEGSDLDAFAQRIRNGHYEVVVHLWQKSGHEVGHRLKAACEEAGVPWVHAASAGVRGVVEGVVANVDTP